MSMAWSWLVNRLLLPEADGDFITLLVLPLDLVDLTDFVAGEFMAKEGAPTLFEDRGVDRLFLDFAGVTLDFFGG